MTKGDTNTTLKILNEVIKTKNTCHSVIIFKKLIEIIITKYNSEKSQLSAKSNALKETRGATATSVQGASKEASPKMWPVIELDLWEDPFGLAKNDDKYLPKGRNNM